MFLFESMEICFAFETRPGSVRDSEKRPESSLVSFDKVGKRDEVRHGGET